MTLKEAIIEVNASSLSEACRAWIYAALEKLPSVGSAIWPMPGSEWRGLPISMLPEEYVRTCLDRRSKSYVFSAKYRELLQVEATRRGL